MCLTPPKETFFFAGGAWLARFPELRVYPQFWKSAALGNHIGPRWKYQSDHFSGIEGMPSFLEKCSRWRFLVMAIISTLQNTDPSDRKLFSLDYWATLLFWLSLIIAYYKVHDFITIPVLPSILEILPSIPEKWGRASKMANFGGQKVSMSAKSFLFSPNPYCHVLLAKNGVQIGQILLLWPNLYFTSGYRGSPPCTLSHYPDNRETGYSNVLDQLWPIWTNLDQSGPIWTNLDQSDQSGPIWTNFDQSVPIWTNLDKSGPSWTNINQSGPIWTNLEKLGPIRPIWTNLDKSDQSGPTGPIWTNLD